MTPRAFMAGFAALAFTRISIVFSLRTNDIQWVDCESNVPQPLQDTELPTELPSTLRCGRLDVPMDYSKPFSIDNKITLGFSMYRPDNPQGLVNFNPGGPGAEVASYAWQIALNLTKASLFAGLESFDFLAMDVRGSHSSNPLNCSIGNLRIPSSLPANETEFKASQATISTFARSCIDLSTPKGIVAHVGTTETVEDWNNLREALSYEKLHFFSVSYGTFGASLYAKRFPRHVGRFVLDSAIPHGLTDLELVTYKLKAANRLLLRADAYCMYDAACPFHSQGKGSVVNAFSTVLERAESGSFSNTTANDVRAKVTLAYLSGTPNFSALNIALYEALGGNWSALSYDSSFGLVHTMSSAPVLPLLCLDAHLDDNTFSGFTNIRKNTAKYDPAQFKFTQDLSWIVLCGGWPYHGNLNQKLLNSAPMLLVNADFDLNTPMELATFEWNQAQKSTLIVRHGDGHGTFIVPGPAQTAEVDFLATGQFPNATNQTLLTIYAPYSKKVPIADPYTAPIGPLAGDFIRK